MTRFWRIPLDQDKVRPVCGQVHVLPERCKGCSFCIQFCPRQVLEESADMNQKGYKYPVAVNPEQCAACGLCEALCPDFAITVTEKGKEKAGV